VFIVLKAFKFFLDYTKPTYCPTACIELSRNAELQINCSSKELTCKNSSEILRSNLPFGFNGKEKDDELKGEGNSLDFGGRIYDSRLGRWLSLDPTEAKYPGLSPYVFSYNSPLIFKVRRKRR
jgi:RHS repeat-associated protein